MKAKHSSDTETELLHPTSRTNINYHSLLVFFLIVIIIIEKVAFAPGSFSCYRHKAGSKCRESGLICSIRTK